MQVMIKQMHKLWMKSEAGKELQIREADFNLRSRPSSVLLTG